MLVQIDVEVCVQCLQLREATQRLTIFFYIICCKYIIMQALVLQFGYTVGTSFLFVCADLREYAICQC